MEREQNIAKEAWGSWEAAPRDGPAVYVVHASWLDSGNGVRGRWLNPCEPLPELYEQLTDAIGATAVEDGDWAVIDQVRLGDRMMPEQLSLRALHDLANDLAEPAKQP